MTPGLILSGLISGERLQDHWSSGVFGDGEGVLGGKVVVHKTLNQEVMGSNPISKKAVAQK